MEKRCACGAPEEEKKVELKLSNTSATILDIIEMRPGGAVKRKVQLRLKRIDI